MMPVTFITGEASPRPGSQSAPERHCSGSDLGGWQAVNQTDPSCRPDTAPTSSTLEPSNLWGDESTSQVGGDFWQAANSSDEAPKTKQHFIVTPKKAASCGAQSRAGHPACLIEDGKGLVTTATGSLAVSSRLDLRMVVIGKSTPFDALTVCNYFTIPSECRLKRPGKDGRRNMRTRVRGKSVGSGVASRWGQFLRLDVRPPTSWEKALRLVSAALMISLAGCGDKGQIDGNTSGPAHAVVANAGEGAGNSAAPDNQQAESSGTMAVEGIVPMPEQSAGLGHLTRLNASEIRSRLVGQMLMPDRRVRQASMEFAEEFLPDGTWVSRRTARRIEVKQGTWRIVQDQICVTATDRPALCRRVWTDSRGRVAMRDMESPLETIVIMTVSPIRT